MEALLVRIDHFHDRAIYVSTIKTWLNELGISHGRLVTMGDFHLLFIEATSGQNSSLLSNFSTKNVDTNAKNEPCTDKFIDIVGRIPIASSPCCKGFLEMNVLNASLLERLMVNDWHVDKAWLTDALSTPRTKALIKWKEDAKNSRKDRRKRAAQDRDVERAAKKARAEQEKKELEEKKALEAETQDSDDEDEEKEQEEKEEEEENENEKQIEEEAAPSRSDEAELKPQKPQKPQKPKQQQHGSHPPKPKQPQGNKTPSKPNHKLNRPPTNPQKKQKSKGAKYSK